MSWESMNGRRSCFASYHIFTFFNIKAHSIECAFSWMARGGIELASQTKAVKSLVFSQGFSIKNHEICRVRAQNFICKYYPSGQYLLLGSLAPLPADHPVWSSRDHESLFFVLYRGCADQNTLDLCGWFPYQVAIFECFTRLADHSEVLYLFPQ